MNPEGNFAGTIEPDTSIGLNGGTIALSLSGGSFELTIERHFIYSIEQNDTVRGTYDLEPEGIVLSAREHYSCTRETEKRESTREVSRTLLAQPAGAGGDPTALLTMRVDLDMSPFRVVLERQ